MRPFQSRLFKLLCDENDLKQIVDYIHNLGMNLVKYFAPVHDNNWNQNLFKITQTVKSLNKLTMIKIICFSLLTPSVAQLLVFLLVRPRPGLPNALCVTDCGFFSSDHPLIFIHYYCGAIEIIRLDQDHFNINTGSASYPVSNNSSSRSRPTQQLQLCYQQG